MSELLLELFSEEIPALMQKNAEEAYLDIFTKIFEENEIFAKVKIFVGPRRITAHVTHLPKYILPKEIEIKGPKIDAPDQAIQGFCKANNTSKLHLSTKLINDYLYYFFIKKIAEQDIKQILPDILVSAINKYIWPKSMYWGDYKIKWIRPLRNILCIFDGEIVPLKFGHLIANNITYGHRLTGNKSLIVASFDDYKKQLLEHDVIIDRLERIDIIKIQLQELANLHNLSLKEDDRLLEEVAGLVEFPCALIGSIPKKFLKLPEEVLTSSMRTHQKYFSLFNETKLLSKFAFIANGKFANPDLIIQGNEKVLSARLSDALYFYEQDLTKPLESALIKLEKVTFHEKLGNLKQKVERIEQICCYLNESSLRGEVNTILQTAAKLCKSDLVSEMVGEFPELQGVMGYYYALHEGLESEIASTIKDHYKPQGPSDNIPTGEAALLAIADKMDSIVGLMIVGEGPTGSGDPYALRRQALGIIRIIWENKLRIRIRQLLAFILKLYKALDIEMLDLITDFFEERVKFYFKSQYDISLIKSILDLGLDDDLFVVKLKLDALQQFLSGEEGKELLSIYKRINNILEKKEIEGEIDPTIFTSKYETNLFDFTEDLFKHFEDFIVIKDFTKALNLLNSLLTPVTEFFDNVMVNDKDPKIAKNRLLLLQYVRRAFHEIAQFSYL